MSFDRAIGIFSEIRAELRLVRSDGRRRAVVALGVCMAALLSVWLCSLPRDLFSGVPYSTVVEASDGEILGARVASDGQWRFPPADTVPQRYALCLVQFEDRRFNVHHGVDPAAVVRAAVQNLRAGHTVSGGSTITMQVIRLSRASTAAHCNPPQGDHGRGFDGSLSGGESRGDSAGRFDGNRSQDESRGRPGGNYAESVKLPERTFREKIIEAVLAVRLELRCSKEEIMALYASHAPFGGNIVGLEAASRRYFARPASELSWAEAAMLAVLPNSPSLIHPGRNRAALERKRNRLLTRLYDTGTIDSMTLALACSEPLPDNPRPFPDLAHHLVERYCRTNPGETVRTAIDISLQQRLEALADRWNNEFARAGIRDLSAVIIDVRTGATLAYCGNANHSNLRDGALVDIADSPRSTGSVLKPFLYGAMLQSGDILPHELIPDTPLNVNGFSPQNFDLRFSGAVSASEALARSLNVPYVRMLRTFGISNFCDFLKKSGMTTLTRPASDYGLSLILGGAEGKLYEMTRMYAAMSAYYQYHTDWLPPEWPLVSRCALHWIFDTLKEVNRPDEMDWRIVPSLRKVAWKTGTSYGFRDAWAIGVTRDFAVGVWAGNANGESASGLVGARTAGPVLFDIYNMLPPSVWFDEPERGEYVYAETCRKSGHLHGRFCEECDSLIIPPAGLRSSVCPYHRSVLLTPDGTHRLSSPAPGCITKNFFVLPPAMEWYYRRSHPDYIPLPPLLPGGQASDTSSPLAFIYPEQGSSIFIPKALDGSDGEVVFTLAHLNPETEVFWHLDSCYIGRTKFIHSLSVRPSKGLHELTAVDSFGNIASVQFSIEN